MGWCDLRMNGNALFGDESSLLCFSAQEPEFGEGFHPPGGHFRFPQGLKPPSRVSLFGRAEAVA